MAYSKHYQPNGFQNGAGGGTPITAAVCNDWENELTLLDIGGNSLTVNQGIARPTGNTTTEANLLSQIAMLLKEIKGTTNWYDVPIGGGMLPLSGGALTGLLTGNVGALGTTSGNTRDLYDFMGTATNGVHLKASLVRTANGSDWTTSLVRLARVTDSTQQQYIDFQQDGATITLGGSTTVTNVLNVLNTLYPYSAICFPSSAITAGASNIYGMNPYQWGLFINSGGCGLYDWQNNRSILSYTTASNTVTLAPYVYMNGFTSLDAYLGSGDSNHKVKITSGWTGYPDGSVNGSEIANDTGTYKALMIAGNKSAGGSRKIQMYDDVTVGGSLNVGGTIQIAGVAPKPSQFMAAPAKGSFSFSGSCGNSATPRDFTVGGTFQFGIIVLMGRSRGIFFVTNQPGSAAGMDDCNGYTIRSRQQDSWITAVSYSNNTCITTSQATIGLDDMYFSGTNLRMIFRNAENNTQNYGGTAYWWAW